MNRCYLSLGSNQKYPERQIRTAIKQIKTLPATAVIKTSSLYWSKAWGLQNQQDFCNVVIELSTRLDPFLLLDFCQKIEHRHGRVRTKHWGPRTLDIDLILYGTRTIKTAKLTIPHPYFLERNFVMEPLLQLGVELNNVFKSKGKCSHGMKGKPFFRSI